MRHRCADDFYTPAGQRCQLLSVIAFRSGDRNEQKRGRKRECGRARANERQRRESMSIVSETSRVGFFGVWHFLSEPKSKLFAMGDSLHACVHVCAWLCLSVFGFSPPLLFPLPSCICRRSSIAYALFCPTFFLANSFLCALLGFILSPDRP